MDLFKFLHGKKILLAEDEPYNQELILDIFDDSGCHLTIVDNGAQAVEKFQIEEFDIVLMDVQMPIMDGYTATQEIRKIETSLSRDRTVIIAITANALSGDRERCFKVGMDEYLSKPIKLGDLRDILYSMMH